MQTGNGGLNDFAAGKVKAVTLAHNRFPVVDKTIQLKNVEVEITQQQVAGQVGSGFVVLVDTGGQGNIRVLLDKAGGVFRKDAVQPQGGCLGSWHTKQKEKQKNQGKAMFAHTKNLLLR